MRPALTLRSILLSAAWFTATANAATLTVGGSGCQFPTVQKALDHAALSAASDEIRVANTLAYTQQALTKSDPYDVSVTGGYANCNIATSPTGSTVLDGSGRNASVLTVTNGNIQLANLVITGGAPLSGRGGGVPVRGSAQLTTFSNVRITANRAREGGGDRTQNRGVEPRFVGGGNKGKNEIHDGRAYRGNGGQEQGRRGGRRACRRAGRPHSQREIGAGAGFG